MQCEIDCEDNPPKDYYSGLSDWNAMHRNIASCMRPIAFPLRTHPSLLFPEQPQKRLCHTSDTTSILSVRLHPTITTREGREPSARPRWHESLAHVSASLQYDSAGCWPYQPWIFPRADRLVSYSSASWWIIDGRFYRLVPSISIYGRWRFCFAWLSAWLSPAKL